MMMFKIISKKKYERLCYENDKLHEEVAFLRKEKEGEVNHFCHEVFCNDCVHALKISRSFDMCVQTFCDLDRHCKDYAKKHLTEKDNA